MRIPELNAVVTVPLFERPVRIIAPPARRVRVRLDSGEIVEALEAAPEDETEEAFARRLAEWEPLSGIALRVQLVDYDTADAERRQVAAAVRAEAARVAAQRAATTREASPGIFLDSYETDEGAKQIGGLTTAWLKRVLKGIDGLTVGDQPSSEITDVEVLIRILQRMLWHHLAARRARNAQHLHGVQLLD